MEDKIVATNRQARYNYIILEAFEAGIELKGTEVKSLRNGRANLKDSFAKVENGEAFLYNMHILPYEFGNIANVDPIRARKLLLHKREIKYIAEEAAIKRLAVVPLKVYFKSNRAKVEIALAKGKKLYDKREAIRRRESERELKRVTKGR